MVGLPEDMYGNAAGARKVVIIGAGIGGLMTAIALKTRLGFHNFTIFEKATDVGGTWRDNVYPGCSSDVAIHFYSYSSDLKPDWPTTHGYQPEIQSYWRDLAIKYDLFPHVRFSHKVVSAFWQPSSNAYLVTVENVLTGEREKITAHVLISAIGVLEVPRYPEIDGIGSFKGEVLHSARWDSSVQLAGKKVAVIGNGASATQFVPVISENPDVKITNFMRTPNWFLPPVRASYSGLTRWAHRNIPLFTRAVRLRQFLLAEFLYFSVFSNKFSRALMSWPAKQYIRHTAPKEYREKLVPKYALGCKRIIFDTGYLEALHRPNLSLNFDGIDKITEDGILTKKGEHLPFDVLIFATGFVVDEYPIDIHGEFTQSVQEYYNSQDGPKAYLGTTIPGFPNFCLVAGPNTATGHTSVIFTEEVQINYITQLITPVLTHKIASFDASTRATDVYNAKIQARLSKSTFVNCLSWYRKGGNGKVTSIFPGAGTLFWWWLRRPTWQDFQIQGSTPEWEKSLRRAKAKRALLKVVLVISVFVALGAASWLGAVGIPGGVDHARAVWENVVEYVRKRLAL